MELPPARLPGGRPAMADPAGTVQFASTRSTDAVDGTTHAPLAHR